MRPKIDLNGVAPPHPGSLENIRFTGWSKRQGCGRSLMVCKWRADQSNADLDAVLAMTLSDLIAKNLQSGTVEPMKEMAPVNSDKK